MNHPSPRLWQQLIFLHGHIADPALAQSLSDATAEAAPADPSSDPITAGESQRSPSMNLFKSLLYLGGLESIDSRIGEDEEAYGQTYGNRVASARTFGQPASSPLPGHVKPVGRRNAARDGGTRVGTGPVAGVPGGCA